jgi:hypothetical protein
MSRVLRLPRPADSVILGCQARPGKLRRCFVKATPPEACPERSRRAVFEIACPERSRRGGNSRRLWHELGNCLVGVPSFAVPTLSHRTRKSLPARTIHTFFHTKSPSFTGCKHFSRKMFFAVSSLRDTLAFTDTLLQFDLLDVSTQRCALQVAGESSPGACDQVECGHQSYFECASGECANCPCERHVRKCPGCHKFFCDSSDKCLWTCFDAHVSEKACSGEVLRVPLTKLSGAFDSGKHDGLDEFVNRNSDGLGTPLPCDVCIHLALAVACASGFSPEYGADILSSRQTHAREQRAHQQRLRRAAKKLGAAMPDRRKHNRQIASHKNSTIHIVTGALVVRDWTNSWHYREQLEMLSIMGLHKGEDFIRDRLDYVRTRNGRLFRNLELLAAGIGKQRRLADRSRIVPAY